MNKTYLKARHGAERLIRGAPQYIDLKQLAELEHLFARHCRSAIRAYRHWKRAYAGLDDPLERHYRDLEGALLRRQAEDAARLYGIIRKDARRSFRKYMAHARKIKF